MRNTDSPVRRARAISATSQAMFHAPSRGPVSSRRQGVTSLGDRVVDHVDPRQHAVQDGPEDGVVRAPRNGDGKRRAKADAGARGFVTGGHAVLPAEDAAKYLMGSATARRAPARCKRLDFRTSRAALHPRPGAPKGAPHRSLRTVTSSSFPQPDLFAPRHIGPSDSDVQAMLQVLGYSSLDALIDATVPPNIRFGRALNLPAGLSEQDALADFKALVAPNQVWRSFIGQGYYGTHVPAVIQRNILENPGWYTAYTPYQAEIAQGRLEALLNYQTVVIDLTGLPLANASLLDEGTAAAESMLMLHSAKSGRDTFLVADDCHPQTIDVVKARAAARGITVQVQPAARFTLDASVCGVLIQYPNTFGAVEDYRALCDRVHAAGALVVVATDLLALTVLTPPGEWGADVAIGNAQRFGVPYGYGGPHAAFLATKEEFKRLMPGRIIGVSRDTEGKPGMRMALGTREQHIRSEKATSNICTAQVLLAVRSGMYAVFHGPDGLKRIAQRVHHRAETFATGVRALGHSVLHDVFFDTVHVSPKGGAAAVLSLIHISEPTR